MQGRRMANCFLYRTVIPDFTNSKSVHYASSTKVIIEVESCDWLYPFLSREHEKCVSFPLVHFGWEGVYRD